MERRPPLVDREAELSTLKEALNSTAGGRGELVLLGGPVGIGKSRLIEEALALATASGFEIGLGRGVVESYALYHPWFEAFRPLRLDHLLREEPPPRLLAVYLLSESGIVVAKAERSGFSQGGAHLGIMLNNAAEFLRDAVTPSGASLERDLLRFSHGQVGVVVLKAAGYGLLILLEGRETEILLQDLRRLAEDLDRGGAVELAGWDGNKSASARFESFLQSFIRSGKWEGIDYAADGAARKLNLFENVLFGLRRRSAEIPIAVALDDLQWADPSSLGLLHYLSRNTRDVSVLLVGSFRTEGGRPSDRLREAISTLAREELGRVLEIDPLPEEACAALAGGFMGRHEVDEPELRGVLRNAEGNPLFIREVLLGLETSGALSRRLPDEVYRLDKPAAHLPIPGKIQEALAMRLDRLAHEERETLEVASVCGTRFEGALVAALSGESPAKVLRRLNAIARSQDLIRAEEDGWRFGQNSIREFLYQGLAPELRRHYHREAGEYVLRQGAATEIIGDHFALAKDPRAGSLLKEVGDRALRQGASEEAVILYRRAVEFTLGAERQATEESLASALDLAGRGDEALQAIDRARALGMPLERWAAVRARILDRASRWKQAIETIDEALATAEGYARAILLTEKVRPLIDLSEFDQAKEVAEEALRLLPPESGAQKGRILAALAIANYGIGREDEAASLGKQALEFLEPIGDLAGSAIAYRSIGHAAYARGALQEAGESYAASLRASEAAGDRRSVGLALACQAEVFRIRGETQQALELNRRAIEVFERVGASDQIANATINVGSLLEMEGKHEAALDSFERGIKGARNAGTWFMVVSGLAESPFTKVALGRSTEAAADATEAVQRSGEKGLAFLRPFALQALAFVEVATGQPDRGRGHFQEALAGFVAARSRVGEAGAHLWWGRAEFANGAVEEARQHLRKAEQIFVALALDRRVEEVRRELEHQGARPDLQGR